MVKASNGTSENGTAENGIAGKKRGRRPNVDNIVKDYKQRKANNPLKVVRDNRTSKRINNAVTHSNGKVVKPVTYSRSVIIGKVKTTLSNESGLDVKITRDFRNCLIETTDETVKKVLELASEICFASGKVYLTQEHVRTAAKILLGKDINFDF